jgi:hypothetical protein
MLVNWIGVDYCGAASRLRNAVKVMRLNLPQYIFINGPPRVGKSTLAEMLDDTVAGIWIDSFAEPSPRNDPPRVFPRRSHNTRLQPQRPEIKQKKLFEFAALFDLDIEGKIINPSGMPASTIEEAMTSFANDYMRKLFGADILGRLCYRRCMSLDWQHFIIDDAEHPDDTKFIIDQAGAENCALIRIHRAGFDFHGDNRNYLSFAGVRTLDIQNDGSTDQMREAAAAMFTGDLKKHQAT